MAGKSILDIIIKLSKQGGADQETIKGLANLKKGITEAVAVAGSLVAAGYATKAAFDATVGPFVAYADEVRNVAQMTGLTAEESSKLVQVTDDYKISAEDLQKVIAKNGDIYDYSIEGLAGMSAEYNSLATAEEKAAYMQEHFGKNWGQFVELMKLGKDEIIAAGNGINEALILDEAGLQAARDYQMQVDALNDSWTAYKITVGSEVIPITNQVLTGLNNTNAIRERANQLLMEGVAHNREEALSLAATSMQYGGLVSKIDQASAARLNGLAGMYESIAASEEMAAVSTETADTMTEDYGRILKDAETLYAAQTDYAEQYKQISSDMSLSDQERAAKLQALGVKYDAVTTKIVSDNMLQKLSVDGLEQAEYERYLAFQVATGQMTAAAAEQAAALNAIAEAGANGTMSIEQMQAAIDALNDKTVTLTVNVQWNGGGDSTSFGFDEFGFNDIIEAQAPGQTTNRSGGKGGAGAVVVNLTMNNVVSLGDRAQAERDLVPFVIAGIREAQARGVL